MAQIGYVMSTFRAVMLLLVTAGVSLLLVAVFYRRPATVLAVTPPPLR